METEAEQFVDAFCKDIARARLGHKKVPASSVANDPDYATHAITHIIAHYSHMELSAFLDMNPWAAHSLKRISFFKDPKLATKLMICLINSAQFELFRLVLLPKRAPRLAHTEANQMPATARAEFARACINSMTPETAEHAVLHLLSYLHDYNWYTQRGSVQDGSRPWKLWRHITHFDESTCRETRWLAIKSLVSTCPGGLSISGYCSTHARQADKKAIRLFLNPPHSNWLTEGIALARKINPGLMHVSAISPYSKTAVACYRAIRAEQPSSTAGEPAFRWHPPQNTTLNTKFLVLTARQDHLNNCLLTPPSDLLTNRESLVVYCALIARFSEIAHYGPSDTQNARWSIRIVSNTKHTAFLFATCALLGIYLAVNSSIRAINALMELSKQVTIGDKVTLWGMLWKTHYGGLCLAQTIGVRTVLGGTIGQDNRAFCSVCPKNVFFWMHDIARVFSDNPYIEVAECCFAARTAPLAHRQRLMYLISASIGLHQRHPDIGREGGVYEKPEDHHRIITCLGTTPREEIKRYVLSWLLPTFSVISRNRRALIHQTPKQTKREIRTWLMAMARNASKKAMDRNASKPAHKKLPTLNTDIEHMIVALCM